jgi:hypothetical protein
MSKKIEDYNGVDKPWLGIISILIVAILCLGMGIFFLKEGKFYGDYDTGTYDKTESPLFFWIGTIGLILLGVYSLISFIKIIYLKVKKKI